VQFGHARMVALERIRVALVASQQSGAHVGSMGVSGRGGVGAAIPAVQTELRERRRLELLVGDDFGVSRMVQCLQLDLVDIGNFAQFLSHADFVGAIARLQSMAAGMETYSS
jgi:hypothetical protein